MVGRRDWSQAMVFRVGKKYQQSVCSSVCLCGNSDHWAHAWSRRGFLASSAAAAAAPVILATDTDRACAQTMGPQLQQAGIRLTGQEVVAALNSDNDRLVPMYKDIHQNPDRGFMQVRPSGGITNQLSERGFQVKMEIRKTAVVGILRNRCRTVDHLPPRYGPNAV